MRMFYVGLVLWSCGDKKVQNATISSNQNKSQLKTSPILNESEVSDQETSQKKPILQLKYFHKDFVEKGSNPRFSGVDVTYVSEQQLLDDLYLVGKRQEHFYPCQSTGATLLNIEGDRAQVQLQGGCGGCGSFGIYDHISETLQQLQHIAKVQILAPNQKSETQSDRPSCLEP